MSPLTGIGRSTLACLVAICAARPVMAQVILEGRVLDDQSGASLAGARVVLLNQYTRFVARAVADEQGQFRFDRKGYGAYRVEASAVGYRSALSPLMWMTMESDSTVVEIRLAPHIVLLAPLEVIALRPVKPSPVLESTQYRRRQGFAVHITRQEIAQRQPAKVSDVLLEIPGIYAARRGSGSGELQLYMARALPGGGGGECPVQVFLDGRRATRDANVQVDELVNPLDVEAIEVFRGLASIPPEFLTPEARCGVIAIWTRRALPPG